jgi:hypothetical protein
MKKPPCPESWYRATDTRRRINGHWTRNTELIRGLPQPVQQYLGHCKREGIDPQEEVVRFLMAYSAA